MITGQLIGNDEFIRRIDALPSFIHGRLLDTITRLTIQLQANVKQDKLSDNVLMVRTGRLRRSITNDIQDTGYSIIGIVGTNVSYGKFWEEGFSRKVGAGARGGPRTLQGAAIARYISKHPSGIKNYGPRSFLKSALADMQQKIVADIEKALIQGAKDGIKK